MLIKPAEKNQKKKEPISFIKSFLPNNFRDQDFVFRSTEKGAVGKKMFREALFLAFKWEEFNKNRSLSSDSLDLDKLSPKDPLFKTYPALSEKDNSTLNLQSNESGNALNQLLKTKVPDDLLTVNTRDVLGFRNQKISNIAVRTFFTGPEDNGSDFEKVLIERIHSAKQRISIDQMYFQPSKKLMQEIINAANRGVKVTVVTALGGRRNSSGEKFFGPRNKYNLHTLFYSVTNKENINIYTYSQGKNGLHKKVVVIDDSVLAGSSNMGTKSLKLTGDHEMNFEATSKEFADKTLKIIQEDISKSKKLNKISLSLSDRILSFIHNTGSRIWG